MAIPAGSPAFTAEPRIRSTPSSEPSGPGAGAPMRTPTPRGRRPPSPASAASRWATRGCAAAGAAGAGPSAPPGPTGRSCDLAGAPRPSRRSPGPTAGHRLAPAVGGARDPRRPRPLPGLLPLPALAPLRGCDPPRCIRAGGGNRGQCRSKGRLPASLPRRGLGRPPLCPADPRRRPAGLCRGVPGVGPGRQARGLPAAAGPLRAVAGGGRAPGRDDRASPRADQPATQEEAAVSLASVAGGIGGAGVVALALGITVVAGAASGSANDPGTAVLAGPLAPGAV